MEAGQDEVGVLKLFSDVILFLSENRSVSFGGSRYREC